MMLKHFFDKCNILDFRTSFAFVLRHTSYVYLLKRQISEGFNLKTLASLLGVNTKNKKNNYKPPTTKKCHEGSRGTKHLESQCKTFY